MNNKILVIIPAYNEAKVIDKVLKNVYAKGFHDILVVDDGSKDDTYKIAEQNKCEIVRHRINRGLGAALRTGFNYAKKNNYYAVVTLDADGQHDPIEAKNLVKCLDKYDFVIGSRMQHKNMIFIRKVYNKIAATITRILGGADIKDSQSGFRAIKVDLLRKMKLRTSRMEISSELIMEAGRLKAKTKEVPIKAIYTQYSLSKGQSLLRGVYTLYKLIMRKIID